MKKEQKRYYLVEYGTCLTKEYNSQEELDTAIKGISRYNNRKTEPYIVGNITATLLNGKYYLEFHVYNKLMPKTNISSLDKFTSKYDEYELILELKDSIKSIYPDNNKDRKPHYPDINIAYFEDTNIEDRKDYVFKRIKYIPVLYKDDLKYMNENYIYNCISFHAKNRDYKYFEGILKQFGYSHSSKKYLDELESNLEKVKYDGLDPLNLYYDVFNFYNSYIVERAKDGSILRDEKGSFIYSERRLRDFGFYTKNYESNRVKKATVNNYVNDSRKQRDLENILKDLEQGIKLVR